VKMMGVTASPSIPGRWTKDVQENPDRQSRRNRVPGDPHRAASPVMLNLFQHPFSRRSVRVAEWTLKRVQGDGLGRP
jgi:hypothetical protein